MNYLIKSIAITVYQFGKKLLSEVVLVGLRFKCENGPIKLL